MSEEEKIALFDAYSRNEMSLEDRADFERLLEKNEEFAADFEAYKLLAGEIVDSQEYAEISRGLKGIHKDLYDKKKPLLLRPKFLVPMGIAASIALIITIWSPQEGSMAEDSGESADYVELMHDVDDAAEEGSAIEDPDYISEEEAMIDSTVDILDEVLPMVKSEPKGSCFLISKKGYFVTSKHLVKKRKYVNLQQKDRDVSFRTEVIYRDSILDFAVLRCSELVAENFKAVPFKFYRNSPSLGDDVFTLGYPKSDIVYTKGVVSSETGFRSDSMSFQISMPSNPGNSGAPLFTKKGDLVGMVIANHSKKQSVTYILKPDYIQERLKSLNAVHDIDMSKNYSKRFNKTSDLISKYRPYIFEIH